MFEKKQLERFSRRDRDIVLDLLKKGVSQLTRLRHPKILSILHPLEESRSFTMFSSVVELFMPLLLIGTPEALSVSACPCVWVCVLSEQYLRTQWREFHQTLVDGIIEATD